MRTLAALSCCLLLAACNAAGVRPTDAGSCTANGDPGTTTRLTMIRRMVDGEHPYAALAHLDASGIKGTGADLLRADILRKVERNAEAATLYRSLLGTCMAGAGHHGLGLLYGQEKKYGDSLQHLRQARQLQPVDPLIRSDLGYVLLLTGDREGARIEFLTALDLAPDYRKAALNLVLLHYMNGDIGRAEALAQRHQASPDELAGLRREAMSLASPTGENR